MLKNNSGKRVAFIASCLNESLQNKDLHDYIFNKFNVATSKSCKDIHVLDNGLKIFNKNGDIFEIKFEPNISSFSKIITNFSCWNNHCIEHKIFDFDNEKITVTEFETTIYVFENKQLSSVRKNINKRDFINNELVYKYSYTCETDLNIESKHSGSTEEIIYVLPDKRATKLISIVGEENYFGNKGTCYCKTNYCDEVNFDTRKQNKGVYSYGMSTCSKEEYEQLIDEWNKQYKNKVKEKI